MLVGVRGVPLPQWGLLRGRLARWAAPRLGNAAVHRRLQLCQSPNFLQALFITWSLLQLQFSLVATLVNVPVLGSAFPCLGLRMTHLASQCMEMACKKPASKGGPSQPDQVWG